MRTPYGLMLSMALILAAGCSAGPATVGSGPQTPSMPADAPGPGLDPAAVGKQLLETKGGTRWLEPPTAVLVQEMTLAEAHAYLPAMSPPEDQPWSQRTRVWFVIFRGRWQLMPYGQTEGPPAPAIYGGCGFVLFTAAESDVIAMGDSRCPGEP